MPDPTKHFDAPAPPSTWAEAAALVRTHWSIAIATIVATAIVGALAFGLLVVDRLATAGVDASIGATALFVLVDTRSAASEVEALGMRIKALPGVAGATLRPRDEALRALVARGLPPPEGRNPLPDVWTVRMHRGDGVTRFPAAVAELRRAIAVLPQVESTKVDEGWVAQVDAGVSRVIEGVRIGRPVGCAILALLLVSFGFVTGRSLTVKSIPKMSVLTPIMLALAVSGLLLDAALVGGAASTWNPQPASTFEAAWTQVKSDGLTIVVGSAALALILVIAAVAGSRRVDSHSQ